MSAIRTLLVANRGEIATRIFSTARDMGLRTVAVYADPDAGLPFVRAADVAVRLCGSSATETYLDVAKILDAAARTGADAIHPGYGFLSENAAFAQAVIDAGRTWVGPPPAVIASMGDKVEAKKIAAEAGVPLLPSAVLDGDNPAIWLAAMDSAGVGWPALVKAAAGGGGRGMRIVGSADALTDAVVSARREAESAFGDGTVFAERLVVGGRHVEVQVLGDTEGKVIHLGERECSIQRRHQKIVEEAPSPGITEAVRERLLASGVALAKHIGYVNAGTVEYLVDGEGDDAQFFFLEMNTRLQVEHRVTERVWNRDLVEDQLRIAAGEPLTPTDDYSFHGHAIEVRLYAEDPIHDFAPSFGVVHRRSWVSYADWTIEEGSEVGTAFDPMLAKIYGSWGNRAQAVTYLHRDLSQLKLHGVTTNRDLLVAILEHPAFLEGDTTIDFLERFPELLGSGPSDETCRVHQVAATLVRRQQHQAASPWSWAPHGWRLGAWRTGADTDPADDAIAARFAFDDDDDIEVTFELDGLTHTVWVNVVGDTAYINSSGGQTEWTEEPRFVDPGAAGAVAGGPIAPMPGTVVSVEVAEGDTVEAGQLLVVLEAMKMEHRIEAHADATVEAVLVQPGDRVDAHQLLIRLT